MPKVLPITNVNTNSDDVSSEICPRYLKWIKRIKKFENSRKNVKRNGKSGPLYRGIFGHNRNSKRFKRGNHNFAKDSVEREFVCSKKHGSNNLTAAPQQTRQRNGSSQNFKSNDKAPLRSKSIFFRIRQKGRNFGIRCKTSVDLWRKWIKRGIRWDRHFGTTATPEIDIDNIKHTNDKLKNFTKKSIINEIIPEEDENECETIVETKNHQNQIAQNGCNTQNSGQIGKPSSDENKSKNINKNNPNNDNIDNSSKNSKNGKIWSTNSMNQQSAAAAASSSAAKSSNFTEAPSSDTEKAVNKYPIANLATMNIDKIETIKNVESNSSSALPSSKYRASNSIRNHREVESKVRQPGKRGAVQRAFNKIRLFF